MKKTYRLVLEVDLEEADEENAIQLARSHYRQSGTGITPVNWSRMGGKWRRIAAEEFIPDTEVAIMELIDASDLLDEAGIEVASVSCVQVKLGKTFLRDCSDTGPKHPHRSKSIGDRPTARRFPKNLPE